MDSSPASSTTPTLAFALSRRICSRCLSDQLTTRPLFTRFADAAEALLRTIHSLPTLYPRATLSQLSLYLGRAGATPEHLLARWRDHASPEERGHDYAVVLFRASTPDILHWERLANRALLLLAARDRLLVANIAADGRGPAPATPTSAT